MTQQGDTIQSYNTKDKKKNLKVNKGANQFVWDMTFDGAETLPGMILWWSSLDGPQAVPGRYQVSLNVNGKVQNQSFDIIRDPRTESTQEGMEAQFNFITDVNKTVDAAHQSIKKIRSFNKQLESFQKQYKDNDEVGDLVAKAKTIVENLSEIEKALYQTKNRSNQDPLNFPIKLTNKLGHLNSLVGMGDFPPTAQDIMVKDELSAQIHAQLDTFNKLLSDDIKAFNEAFNKAGLNYLFVEK